MHLYLTEIQQVTLRDVLTTTGLNSRQIDDIFLLLSFKRERVQLAFYYRAQGMTYDAIGGRLGVTFQAVEKFVSISCADIQKYLSTNLVDKL